MKRLIEKFAYGFTRLTFWGKPVPVIEESPSPVPVEAIAPALAAGLLSPDNEPVVPTAALDAPISDALLPEPVVPDLSIPEAMSTEFLELSELLAPAEQPEPVATTGLESEESAPTSTVVVATPDQAPAIQEQSGVVVPTEAAPEKLSLLTRLKNVFRRKSGPDTGNGMETATPDEAVPAVEGEEVEVGRLQRVLTRLSNKWVWIPGLSIILLVPLVTMTWMLMQSTQEKARLQVELQASQKKREQPKSIKQSDASLAAKKQTDDTLETGENSLPESAGGGVDSASAFDAGDCVLTNQASVLKNLKNCIEDFNRTSAH